MAIEPLEEALRTLISTWRLTETVEEELVEEAGTMDVLMEPEDAPDEEYHERGYAQP